MNILKPISVMNLLLIAIFVVSGTLVTAYADEGDNWAKYSYNYSNWNFNPYERRINRNNARYLRRSWETFNDDQFRPGQPPTGFALEGPLGLRFPSTVVGVVSPPLIVKGTIYYVDTLGTVFARNAKTGQITNSRKHWTTTLADTDFTGSSSIAPELYYTAPAITATHLWFHSSLNGRVHAVNLKTGQEVDFDEQLAGTQPFPLLPELPLASSLGEAVVVALDENGRVIPYAFNSWPNQQVAKVVYITEVNVILNDALLQGAQVGTLIALDISDPTQPREMWRRQTIDTDPRTGSPFGSGVSAGSGLAVDTGRGWIFGGTGQNTRPPYSGYPDPAQAPAGFVDRSDAVYAVDIQTGEFVWTNQFHNGDVFDLNNPVPTGPNQPDGVRDADVLSPPILYTTRINGNRTDVVAVGSKGGLFRAIERNTGETLWNREISKATGIGGIQAGAAYAYDTVYVAGFEGIDDEFSNANFNAPGSKFANAFFATFAPSFWADVEDTTDDGLVDTGMRIKVYALRASDGQSRWSLPGGKDFIELKVGATLRHVSVANGLIFVTTTSGQLFVIDAWRGRTVFEDQTVDLNERFSLGLNKPHHAGMNAGTLITQGMVYTPYGAQNNPSGGIIAYTVNRRPRTTLDFGFLFRNRKARLDILENDFDPNGDRLRIMSVWGKAIRVDDAQPDVLTFADATITVYNAGDDRNDPEAAYIEVVPNANAPSVLSIPYVVEDIAPGRVVNGATTTEPEPTHIPRRATGYAKIWMIQ